MKNENKRWVFGIPRNVIYREHSVIRFLSMTKLSLVLYKCPTLLY